VLTTYDDPALDVAVDRVRELSLRLWAVRAAHQPARSRWRGLRCPTCGEAHPCTTLRAAGADAAEGRGEAVSRAGR
jgi:hypothetical protein